MEPFTTLRAIAAPIDITNLDTNQLCPTRFNKIPLTDPDYQRILFNNQRYRNDGTLTDFILNQPPYRDARVLVGDDNFGCGSSRESAVYALVAFGIRAVVAPGFGDIFFSNCTKNGLLPVVVENDVCARWRAALHEAPGLELYVDLEALCVTGPDGETHTFSVHPTIRERMLAGLDDVGITREFDDQIAAFEQTHQASMPWAFRSSG
ncbi:MAG: 3-isopropylmalate dehydratase small subunit [Pseudomonadota bacterium]